MKRQLAFVLAVCFTANVVHADIRSDLNKAFKALNFKANITGARAYEDQSAGFYTGGGLYARAPVRSVNPIHVQMPNAQFDCGKMNIFTGAANILKMNELFTTLKDVIPGSAGYGLALAMQTAVPQIYNVVTEVNDWIQKINAMNLNSCNISKSIVNAAWPRSTTASSYICKHMGISNGIFGDWTSAHHGCPVRRDEVLNKGHDSFNDVLGDKFNIAWKAIRKNSFLSNNKELAELFMSISGTIVKGGQGAKYPQTFPSLAFKQDLIDMLMFGKSSNENGATIYKCDEESKCLGVTTQTWSLKDKSDAYATKIENLLLSLSEKIVTDEEITEEERGLVNKTHIPIQKIMAVEAAFKGGKSPISIVQFRDEIAFEILLTYLEDALNIVSSSLVQLEQAQIDGTIIDRFKQDVRDVRAMIIEKKDGIYRRIDSTLDAIARSQHYERHVLNKFYQYAAMKEG